MSQRTLSASCLCRTCWPPWRAPSSDGLRSRKAMAWVAEGAFGVTIHASLCVLPVLLGWDVGREMDNAACQIPIGVVSAICVAMRATFWRKRGAIDGAGTNIMMTELPVVHELTQIDCILSWVSFSIFSSLLVLEIIIMIQVHAATETGSRFLLTGCQRQGMPCSLVSLSLPAKGLVN
ncbi:hypothetical protein IF2G_10529 [Cordyceps javanica]|nr:hypothetical protein IF2G_10529 [Cordyceps javanica]